MPLCIPTPPVDLHLKNPLLNRFLYDSRCEISALTHLTHSGRPLRHPALLSSLQTLPQHGIVPSRTLSRSIFHRPTRVVHRVYVARAVLSCSPESVGALGHLDRYVVLILEAKTRESEKYLVIIPNLRVLTLDGC